MGHRSSECIEGSTERIIEKELLQGCTYLFIELHDQFFTYTRKITLIWWFGNIKTLVMHLITCKRDAITTKGFASVLLQDVIHLTYSLLYVALQTLQLVSFSNQLSRISYNRTQI
jgi:hypothetical protein